MTVRISPGVMLVALFFAAVGAGGAVGAMLWEPWEGDNGGTEQAVPVPQPTPGEPRLTKQEAVGLVAGNCQNASYSPLISRDGEASYSGDGKWRVSVETANGETHRWTVDETNNSVIPIGVNLLDAACREPPD